jgi:hypothetical protein
MTGGDIYGGETWTLTSTDKNALRIFERQILRYMDHSQKMRSLESAITKN